jgi:hypothetical protein
MCKLYLNPLNFGRADSLKAENPTAKRLQVKDCLLQLMVWFKHIYLSSIAKQVLATNIKHFRVRFLEPTTTGV